ncbi:MAG: hypothetical protein WB992_24320 [Bryobacteraceae bacterium]
MLCLGCGLSAAPPQKTASEGLTIEQRLFGPISLRIEALNEILASKNLLSDPQVRRMVVRSLDEASNDPNWEQLEEDQEYEDYYDGILSTVVEKIATEYHDPSAWKALVSGNYNDDSRFALWLAEQPGALPALLEAVHSTNWLTAGRALYVLAEALARCAPTPSDKTCAATEQKRPDILRLLRKALQDPMVSLAAVRGLGLCGEEQDIETLTHAKPCPRGELPESENLRMWEDRIRETQQQIEKRLRTN